MNTELFKRTPSGLVPTETGKMYLSYAKRVLKITRDLENEISKINHLQSGSLILGTSRQLGTVVLPEILRTFQGAYPAIRVEIVEQDSSHVLEDKLLDGSLDVALLYLPLSRESLQFDAVASEDLLLLLPDSDPAVRQDTRQKSGLLPVMDVRKIADRNFILTQPSQASRRIAQRILNAADIRPKIKYETSSLYTAMRMVEYGMGVSLIPRSYCSLVRPKSVRLYRIEEKYSPQWTLAVCFPSRETLTGAALELTQICKMSLPYLFSTGKTNNSGFLEQWETDRV